MFTKIKEFLFGKPAPTAEAPYKVESPVPADTPAPVAKPVIAEPAKCGCGRSKSGFCEGLHKLSNEEWAAKNAPAKPAPRAKAPAAPKKQQFEKKPVAAKAPAKPRAKAPAKPKTAK